MTKYFFEYVIFPDAIESLQHLGYINNSEIIRGTFEFNAVSVDSAREKAVEMIRKIMPQYMEFLLTDGEER
jgi:hypothetical protein